MTAFRRFGRHHTQNQVIIGLMLGNGLDVCIEDASGYFSPRIDPPFATNVREDITQPIIACTLVCQWRCGYMGRMASIS